MSSKEIRLVTCPKCNPAMDDPDEVTGCEDTLKYLVFGRKCRHCGTELVDLGAKTENEPETEEKQFYIQRHQSGCIGNCLLFWKANDRGYVCNLHEAKVFSQKEMTDLLRHDRGEKFTAWPKDYLDQISVQHVNVQHLRPEMGIKSADAQEGGAA